jgi:hypothetical protein
MCTLLLGYDHPPGAIVVAANRDEAYDRPWDAPGLLEAAPRIVGGRDRAAGGTWLALREAAPRRLVAVLNRREHAPPADPGEAPGGGSTAAPSPGASALPGPRLSRGLLALEAARSPALEALADLLADRVRTFPVAPFTLLAAEAGRVLAFRYEDAELSLSPVAPGLHAWTHGDADDASDDRVRRVLAAARAAPAASPLGFLEALVPALASHDGARAVCLHGDGYGTVSSALVVLPFEGPAAWRFAPGPPCRTPFAPLAAEATGAGRAS